MTAQRCWTNQRITLRLKAAMKTLTKRVDIAQSTTQWCWRPPTTRRGNESPRPDGVKPDSQTADHVVVNYGVEGPEHLPRTNDHEVAQC